MHTSHEFKYRHRIAAPPRLSTGLALFRRKRFMDGRFYLSQDGRGHLAKHLPTVDLRIEATRAAQRTPLHPHHTPPAGAIGPAAGKECMKTQGHFQLFNEIHHSDVVETSC